MKKIVLLVALLATCVFSLSAQSLNADAVGVDMVMPDGVTATIAFYKKWGPANEDIKAIQPKNMKAMIGTSVVKAETESDIGYLRKTYKATDSEAVADICESMKYCGATYGVAWVDYGNRVTRCVFTYKGGKLTYDRMDFFDETNQTYMEYVKKENAKKEKLLNTVGDLTKNFLSPIADAAVAANSTSNVSQKVTPIKCIFRGHDGIRFEGYNIFYENGDIDMDYIIDSAGNYRKNDLLHSYPIVKETVVPKKVQDAVAKMFN